MHNRTALFLSAALFSISLAGCAITTDDISDDAAQAVPPPPANPPKHLELAAYGRNAADFAPRGLLIDGDDIRSIQYDGQVVKGCRNGSRTAWYKSWSYFPVSDRSGGQSTVICDSDKAIAVIIDGKPLDYNDNYANYAVPWNSEAAIRWRIMQLGQTVLANGKGKFNRPSGIAIDQQGNIWVVDSGNNRVQEFDSNGAWLRSIGKKGSGKSEFMRPNGIAVDGHGDVWVADTGNNRVQQLDGKSGAYMNQIGSYGSGGGQLNGPEGVAVDAKGDVWIADSGNARVVKFSPSGAYKGEERGFSHPAALVFDGNNNMWAMDVAEIDKFSDNGAWLATVGANNADELFEPAGITVDSQGNLWAAQGILRRAEKFDSTGRKLQTVRGPKGNDNGQFENVAALAVDKDGNLWTVDSFNNRLQKFDSHGNWLRTVGG